MVISCGTILICFRRSCNATSAHLYRQCADALQSVRRTALSGSSWSCTRTGRAHGNSGACRNLQVDLCERICRCVGIAQAHVIEFDLPRTLVSGTGLGGSEVDCSSRISNTRLSTTSTHWTVALSGKDDDGLKDWQPNCGNTEGLHGYYAVASVAPPGRGSEMYRTR